MKNSEHSFDTLPSIIHEQLVLYLTSLEINSDSYIVYYIDRDSVSTFQVLKSNRRFLFDQKKIISTGLKLKSEKVILFKYSDKLEQNILINNLNVLGSFKALLESFEITLENIYIFNSENLREIKLEDK